MIGRVLTLNGNPNPGPVPFEIALTLTTRFRCSQDEVQVRAALGIDRIRVDESTGPDMSTANLACVDTKKIAASNLYLQAKNLDFGIAGHL
jgi:hypothetical protein